MDFSTVRFGLWSKRKAGEDESGRNTVQWAASGGTITLDDCGWKGMYCSRMYGGWIAYIWQSGGSFDEQSAISATDVFVESVYASVTEAAGQCVFQAASSGAVQPRHGSTGLAGGFVFCFTVCPCGIHPAACDVGWIRKREYQSVFSYFRFGGSAAWLLWGGRWQIWDYVVYFLL